MHQTRPFLFVLLLVLCFALKFSTWRTPILTQTNHTVPLPISMMISSITTRNSSLTLCTNSGLLGNVTQTKRILNLRSTRAAKTWLMVLLMCGDIETNPGPGSRDSHFQCGYCERHIVWDQPAYCCNCCDIWYHKSCISMSSTRFGYLDNNSRSFQCYKCCQLTVASSQFHDYEVSTSNRFSILDSLDESTFTSLKATPKHRSSPIGTINATSPASIHMSPASSLESLEASSFHPVQSTSQHSSNHTSMSSQSDSGSGNRLPNKNNNNWRTITMNANSIACKGATLEHILDYTDPDLILMTETKLDSTKATAEFLSPDAGYTTYRKDRNASGGGVLISVKSAFPSELIDLKEVQDEILWVKINLNKRKNIFAGVFYRQPNSNTDQLESLAKSLEIISEHTKNNPNNTILLGGDFNCKDIDWDNCIVISGRDQTAARTRLLEILAEFSLSQHQREPTRLDKILDLIITNAPGLVKDMSTIPGISDHAIPVADCAIRAVPNRKSPRQVFNFRKAKWEDIKADLKTFKELFLAQCDARSVEDNWNEFRKALLSAMNTHIPSRTVKGRQKLPWWNQKLKRLIRRKQRLFNKAKKAGSPSSWSKFRQAQKDTHKALSEARWNYVNKALQEGLENNNNKPFWQYVKARRQDSVGVAPLKEDGILYTDNSEKADILNRQFQRVFTKENEAPMPNLVGAPYPTCGALVVNVDGVKKLLSSLKINKATGPDNLPCYVLRELAEDIAPILTFIFNQSLRTGTLPTDWVKANVAPIFKKGNTNKAENYRPVSLTCVCCKILEHVVLKHMLTHFETNNILTCLQHGFRAAHSCVTQLITTIHDLMTYRDSNTQIGMSCMVLVHA